MAQADYACASFVCDTNENWNQNGENMQGIKILCVGKVKEKYFRDGIECYVRQVRRKYLMEIVECDDEPTPEGASAVMERQIREKEGDRLLQKIQEGDYVIALCIDGKHYSSDVWRERMQKCACRISGSLVFVIGGSLGLSDAVVKRADEKLSFSAMTFPHQMMRMILCEQIAGIFTD